MTDLDSPRRNNDCYFYYYSTCAKGDNCTFRHEPSALGCETMCSFWKEGKCLNVHCNFRHMELRKNRKAIQCYWETQPGGCLKPHCPFLHQNAKQSLDDYGDNKIGQNTDTVQTANHNDTVQAPDKNYISSVDPLVVNFEEESDSESAPSPIKIKKANVKTLEEIKLERIQAESAAYFSFNDEAHPPFACDTEDDLRRRLLHKMKRKQLIDENNTNIKRKKLNFSENTSLDDHIWMSSKKSKVPIVYRENHALALDKKSQKNKVKIGSLSAISEKGIDNIKIKTLEEIRAERLKQRLTAELHSKLNRASVEGSIYLTESENVVTSTSKDEIDSRVSNAVQSDVSSFVTQDTTSVTNDTIEDNSIFTNKEENMEDNNMAIDTECTKYFENIDEPKHCATATQSRFEDEPVSIIQCEENKQTITRMEESKSNTTSSDLPLERSESPFETVASGSDPFTNELAEEMLLLDYEEDYVNDSLKAEDELLSEIDDILVN